MKRILTALLTLCMVFALALPALAEDAPSSTPTTPTPAPQTSDFRVVAYTVTDVAGGEVTTVKKGDHINIVVQIADFNAAQLDESDLNNGYIAIVARINSTDFTFTGTAEVGQMSHQKDDIDGYYWSYNLLFRDVVYNGTSQTLPINVSYSRTALGTDKQCQPPALDYREKNLTLGQCVLADKENAKTPSLMVRTSGYGEVVTAGEEFTLSLGIYATDGNENLNDVIVTLNLPENVSLSGGSLTQYVGTLTPKATKTLNFNVLPSAGFSGTVADISVTLTGTGADSGAAANATPFTVSVPVTQPDRFEVGQLEMPDTVNVGDTASVTLSYVNKGKRELGNLEARLTGTNIGSESYQYLGNLNAGSEGSVDFDITPDAAGTISGVITLTYEDANGKIQTVSKDFTATAEEYSDPWGGMDPGMEEPMPEEPQQTGLPVWGWVLIVLGGAAVVVVIVVVVRKRKKAKALANLEAEDNDEDI